MYEEQTEPVLCLGPQGPNYLALHQSALTYRAILNLLTAILSVNFQSTQTTRRILPYAELVKIQSLSCTFSTELCGIRQLPSSFGGIVSSHLP